MDYRKSFVDTAYELVVKNGESVPFATLWNGVCEELGLTEEQALKLGGCFGGGMCKGEVCGACTGALMALGLKFGQCDIEDLEIKIEILDGDKKVIETINKFIGNVKEGVEITRTVSITDMSFINTLKSRYFRVTVIGGTISYFD